MDADDLAAFFEGAADRLEANLVRAERQSALELQGAAERHSSGSAGPAELAAADHPFARRHGAPLWGPNEVNVQSGEFRAAWTFDVPRFTGDDLEAAAYNTDPKAGTFLAPGTRFIFARHPEAAAIEDTEAGRLDRLAAAVEAAFTGEEIP